jgi:quinoprotein glucose dehydrogenase
VLDGIGSKMDRNYLLDSILEPSKKIAPGFQSIIVETLTGEIFSGVVIEEDDTKLDLKLTVGGDISINKSEILSSETSSVSAMPSMQGILTPDEVRDLVAYLSSL